MVCRFFKSSLLIEVISRAGTHYNGGLFFLGEEILYFFPFFSLSTVIYLPLGLCLINYLNLAFGNPQESGRHHRMFTLNLKT